MICDRGCGKESTYVTKAGRHVCDKNPSKCPATSPKGRPKPNRAAPDSYLGDHLCDYGCDNKALFVFGNGKYCCMNQAGNCSAKRITAGKKSSNTKNTEVSPGITKATLASRKAAETKLNDVDENGLNAHQRSAIKVAEVKSNKIDPVTGLNAHQVNGRKYSEWLDTSDGQLRRIELAKMASENQNKIDPTTGQKESKRRAKLMVDTKLSNIDENGLNGFERCHWNANGNTGFINGIYWQYSNERRFLERAVALGIINDVKRGPAVSYVFDGEERKYLSDFLIGDNKLFEVKSHYTMFGKNNEYLHKNIAKLSAAAKFGYEVFVVIDDETIPLSTFIGSVSHLLE